MRHLVICFMVLFTPMCLAETDATATGCSVENAAKLVSLQGSLFYDAGAKGQWQPAQLEQTLCEGSRVRIEAYSRASLLLPNGITLRLAEGTVLTLNGIAPSQPTLVDLLKGFVHFISRTPKQLQITTPIANAGPEGTEFALRADDASAELWVYEGAVRFFNTYGDIHLKAGEAGQTLLGQAPRAQIDLKPADAVNWALYYPPLSAYAEPDAPIAPALRAAIQNYRQGRVDLALSSLERTPLAEQSPEFLKIRAAIRLTAGQSQLAMQDIQALLSGNANDAEALALESILALTQNRKVDALNLAERAVSANPQSATAYSALSYSQQAGFELEKALAAAQRASQLAANDAMHWARLSELQLALGLREESAQSATKAFMLDPNLERTQTVQGFSHLFRVDTALALQHFESAVRLDSTAPLPRLGLGLTKIRSGDLEAGRRDLEIAAILDPNNSLLRSYLGKAYYEEKRPALAGDQFDLAKQHDPKDPTPYFYDALRKQSLNRPVEALRDMQQAIELNDNRGVYRSKLLLDEDAAARTANLARIYNDLGFGRVALKEAWKSLGHDATDPSAHRFLSDAYIGQPRYRVARASELLQAQLLQPINITPVQPQLTGENIGILNSTGPGSLSVNEYDSLYTGNGAHMVLNGAYGSRNTLTDNAIVSGVYDKLSMSFGQFHYQTDGFRQNDDYKQDIYNAFAQYAITQDLNVQVELKTEDVRSGDTPFRLNGTQALNQRQAIEQDTVRVGGHYRIDNSQDLLFSSFYTTRKNSINDLAQFDALSRTGPVPLNQFTYNESEVKSYQSELQYIFNAEKFDVTSGAGYINADDDTLLSSLTRRRLSPFTVQSSLTFSNIGERQTEYFNVYSYLKYKFLPNLNTTLGLSYDSYEAGTFKKYQLNPKFGIIWNPTQNLTLRSAAFRTIKRPLTNNQTIEPTQVAGFNQFYDENNGAAAWQYASGIDYKPTNSLFMGGEIIWRDSQQSINNISSQFSRSEATHMAYLYWSPSDWLTLKSEYRFEKFKREFVVNSLDSSNPRSVASHQVPLSINLFHNSGMFAKFSGTFVDQHVTSVRSLTGFPRTSPVFTGDSSSFWVFDALLGYRLPNRLGTLALEGRNLFDNTFFYQSVFDASGPQLSPFIPERQLFVKLSLFY
ncbi:InterPro IPR001440 COGs COG0457 [Methylomonas albis]|uniref:TonB-dependent receptor n=1 Tax=Methylomonas albis TaxID=1854563 RepID=A0ABR9CZR1_9GAMM|nr:FecR domain-containing protein [Methylomonas albis]MBD9356036.1 TonB-dependent receptor [Methylomonas albis]CAD6879082.1 InterPro IPR001440 COGs COG0457 [Methylomonas albis]